MLFRSCATRALPSTLAALAEAHPYEEPAFDVIPLGAKPDALLGSGRAITLGEQSTAQQIAARLRTALGVDVVKIADTDGTIERVGVCPGSGASLVDAAIADGCTCFVTGEMTHHETLAALDRGCSVILAGHTNTERPYMPILAQRLREAGLALEYAVSDRDRAPFVTRTA